MNKYKHYLWPADATTTGEKIFYVFAKLFVITLFLVMELSAFGLFHNFYQAACAKAPHGWFVLGFISTLFAIFWLYETATDSPIVSQSATTNTIIIGAALLLSWNAYAGFFTATY